MGVVPTFPIGTGIQRSDLMFLLDPPFGVAVATGTQTLTTTTWTPITFNIISPDTDPTMWAAGTPGHLVINTPGRYRIGAGVEFNINGTGFRSISVRKNSGGLITGGAPVHGQSSTPVASANTSVQFELDSPIAFAAGDYLELFALQTSGGNLATSLQMFGVGGPAYLSAYWISP